MKGVSNKFQDLLYQNNIEEKNPNLIIEDLVSFIVFNIFCYIVYVPVRGGGLPGESSVNGQFVVAIGVSK